MKYLLSIALLWTMTATIGVEAAEQAITVIAGKPGVFHHFESSGHTSMAIANGIVGIVWEDNSNGTPQVYVAFKDKQATTFSAPRQVSVQGPAYEPAITASGESFIVGWESNDRLWLRLVNTHQQGPIVSMTQAPARQLSLVSTPQQHAVAVWSEQDSKSYHIRSAEIHPRQDTIALQNNRAVDTTADRKEQLYPSVALTGRGMVVAWEDRRQGATRIFCAFAPSGQPFAHYQLLNDFRYSRIREFGSGTGAMRVVLNGDMQSRVMAIWLDKRDFEQGYDVYASFSEDGGRTFGKNEKVQDPLGDNIPQWHATLAMSRSGRIVAAWDDTRDGTPDIWFSERRNNKWSDDDTWPQTSGPGAQTLPTIFFEGEDLHAAWLVREENISSIRYLKK